MDENFNFADSLVETNRDIWNAMAIHPWVKALADGTLPDEALIAWAQQCRLFCMLEGRALHIMRALNPTPQLDKWLVKLGEDTVREPRELAETLKSLNAPVVDDAWPLCLGYGSFIIAAARDGLVEGLGAVYCAERAYLDTWTAVLPSVPEGSRWHDWVMNWSGDEFRECVEDLGRCVNDLVGNSPSKQIRERMEHSFHGVAQFELAFWEMSWKQQGWTSLTKQEQ